MQAKSTGPANPAAGEAVTVTVPDAPGAIETEKGLNVSATGLTKLNISAALVDAPKFPVALYAAVIVSLPTMVEAVDSMAVPLVNVPVPSEVAPLKNVTVPLGTPELEVTVAVKISPAPKAIDPDAALRVVVVGIAVTVDAVAELVEGT